MLLTRFCKPFVLSNVYTKINSSHKELNMEDLLEPQIRENCKLALPEGLKDLMSDISREVLRTQPQNIHKFIADYLEALLEARDALAIASNICNDICKCRCGPELYNELETIGLKEEDLDNAVKIIEKQLQSNVEPSKIVKEQCLLLKLLKKTSIDEKQLTAVQKAIQKAFKRQHLSHRNTLNFQNRSESSQAVHHTLHLHEQNKLKTEELFVAPEFKPCVTTVSSTSLAGSYVKLPKYRPYSSHDSEILSAVPEMEHMSIDYTLTEPKLRRKLNKVKIGDDITVLEEIDEKENDAAVFDETDVVIEDRGWSDDEVQEFIENVEFGDQSTASSIAESLSLKLP